jgi:natural product biosynthesis luciferase-like monooxygenase protein
MATVVPATLVELLRSRAVHQPNQRAYAFLVGEEGEESSITYAQLDKRARSIAALLQAYESSEERALLLYPSGLDYIAGFFGCLYAGTIAVPASPPTQDRREGPLLRLRSMATDCKPSLVLCSSTILSRLRLKTAEIPAVNSARWITTDDLTDDLADQWTEPDLNSNTLAFLQYTSGSTAEPKGTMVSHGNLLNNQQQIQWCFNQGEQSIIVGWLPVYHDMGLIGNVLHALYLGASCILMSPVSFLQSPLRWLSAISKYRATTSGGPNFAYDLCVRRISQEQADRLDLSSWTTAFNGAEPIRNQTMERFAERFKSCGFRWEAFAPCYGLAEATLIVSGGLRNGAPIAPCAQPAALERNTVVFCSDDSVCTRRVVSCGHIVMDHSLAIVDTDTLNRCRADRIGEIWVSGPSVTRGYWGREEETARTFHAYLADSGEGPFLRTGDLGFVKDDQLFVTGRIKDLIIIRGRNLYPQDIELTVERSHQALRQNAGAAFSVEVGDEEGLVVVQEVEPRREFDVDEVVEAIRQSVVADHEVQVYEVVLIEPGTVPKTSSGKIQRHSCRAKFLGGSLHVIAQLRVPSTTGDAAAPPPDVIVSLKDAETIQTWLVSQLAAKLELDPAEIDVSRSIVRYGIDSVKAVELAHMIELGLGVSIPLATFLQGASIAELATEIRVQLKAFPPSGETTLAPEEVEPAEYPLSYGQRAMWFLHQLAPESAAYNLASAVSLREEVTVSALRDAFQVLVNRHSCLRTTFKNGLAGEPVQRVHGGMVVSFEQEDAVALTEIEMQDRLLLEAHRSFDLEDGPLLRVSLFKRSSQSHTLMLVVHHIVADLWSLAVLVDELDKVYEARRSSAQVSLPALKLHYSDYVRWQMELLASPRGTQLWDYWKGQLAGELPVLNLPTDRLRPPVQSYRGDSMSIALGAKTAEALKAMCKERGATVFMGLIAAFQVLLHRHAGQDDLVVGFPTSGRSSAELGGLVGYFVNPLALRVNLAGNPTFSQFLDQVRQTVLNAVAHQEYPFALLVARLQPERDPGRSPLFQTMFIFQKVSQLPDEHLASVVVGQTGECGLLGGLPVESMTLPQRFAQFDLTLTVAEVKQCLPATIDYNTDLFDSATINRMAKHFETLLKAAIANPCQHVSQMPMLTEQEQRQILVEWNATASEYRGNLCVHELIEGQAYIWPDAIAIAFEEHMLSYREFNWRGNQLAHYLRLLGVRTESRIGICVERSVEMPIGMLGILKAGGAYVPLDPSYPQERVRLMVNDAGLSFLITKQGLKTEPRDGVPWVVYLDSERKQIAACSHQNPASGVKPANLAYVIYTSGSTGTPKGVMISHRSVVNFFGAMDRIFEYDTPGVWLAVTSMSFDISVLELLWTLSRGSRVVIQSGQEPEGPSLGGKRAANRAMDFSLFYFASNGTKVPDNRYKLLLEGAKFADRHGFSAVWTPERHFHAFGDLYPNPSVTSAAIAAVTERIKIRAGSIVLPLHNPIRVAEEWSVVDNLSQGRVGISFASGWHADDFVLAPENYFDRKEVMIREIDTVKKLWRGDSLNLRGGGGKEVEIKILPRPVQRELPIWVTAAGAADTFQIAGRIGAGVLSHLLGQSLEDLAEKIELYRKAWVENGHGPGHGHVTLMLHTFVGEDIDEVRETVRDPFCEYLKTSFGLIRNLARSLDLDIDSKSFTDNDMEALLSHAFDRYFETSGLMGTPSTCMRMIEKLERIGVDEVACLIDFGVEADLVMASLHHLNLLRERSYERNIEVDEDNSIAGLMRKHEVSHLQCTPSMAGMMTLDAESLKALEGLKTLLVGGEALPLSLANELRRTIKGDIHNMYGPTETTIWSSTCMLEKSARRISIGRPIANTELYIVDKHMEPVPMGIPGGLCIGGDGVARGYFKLPNLTAEKFIPNAYGANIGSRMYTTGDLARHLTGGSIEFLGRTDHQVKVRGLRIELGEVEAVLVRHAGIRQAAVLVRENSGENRLIAYVVGNGDRAPSVGEMRAFLKEQLPSQMIPSAFVVLDEMLLTPNGKIDRRALFSIELARRDIGRDYEPPRTAIEEVVAAIWEEILDIERVSIHDDFFHLGGHSLLAAKLISRLREVLKFELPLRTFFQQPSIAGISAAILEYPQEQARAQRVAQLLISVAQYPDHTVEAMLGE